MISVVVPVYRDATNALALAAALTAQKLPPQCTMEVILVDDGSGDGTAETLAEHVGSKVRVLALPENRGRSGARNAGADEADGEFLVFTDCDCRPMGEDFLAAHLRLLGSGHIASCGHVTGHTRGFWGRYQRDTSKRRRRQYDNGIAYAGTTPNLAVITKAFLALGGFDQRYLGYGFEDRDLLVRLSHAGSIGWCEDATVRHVDRLALASVATKMRQAGAESAHLFAHDHPEAYRRLGYAALDTRMHAWLRPVCFALSPLLPLAGALDRVLDKAWIPYFVKKTAVKLLSALAFATGTTASHDR